MPWELLEPHALGSRDLVRFGNAGKNHQHAAGKKESTAVKNCR
jgi:hypothetical protein